MLVAELCAEFPWGVLLATDASSSEQIPSWASAEDQVAVASTALVVRVMHQDDGEVTIRVWDEPSEVRGDLAFSGELQVPSGSLRVSDAVGNRAIKLPVDAGPVAVDIFTDAPGEASEVHLVLLSSKR